MLRLTRPQIQPIGLDIGLDSIKMLQLCVSGDGVSRALSVASAAKQLLPDEARKRPEHRAALAAETIRRMFAQQPFVGRRVVAALPREIVHVKNLRLPRMTADELPAAVETEARSLFTFDPAEACIRFLPAGEVRQGNEIRQEVIVIASRQADVDDFVQQLHGSGVEIDSLDCGITGMFRAFERFVRRKDDEQDVQVLLDIGARQSQVIIAKGRDISFYKQLDIGGLHLLDAVSRKLGISIEEAKALRQRLLDAGEGARRDPVRQAVYDATRNVAEDLGRELAMCLRYYLVTFRGQRPSRLRLVGGEAADPQLHAIFTAILSIPVEAARPLYSIDTMRMRTIDRQGPMSQWALALGLSLRHVAGYFSPKDGRPRVGPVVEFKADEETRGQGDETRRHGDKETRGQGDKEKEDGDEPFSAPLVPLSPCPLVSVSPLVSSNTTEASVA
ncbi:MAG TPA: pilus assembly protein PilM [Tepidisphaeraceae bacterium]|nr:pilus assembly protein PilM [Tepidisphaeraceae bacterium]